MVLKRGRRTIFLLSVYIQPIVVTMVERRGVGSKEDIEVERHGNIDLRYEDSIEELRSIGLEF